MKKFLVLLCVLSFSGCFNKAEVPAEIQTSGTVTVRHEIVVSIEMKELFRDECEAELGPDAYEEDIQDCVADKEAAFIQAMLDFLNQESGG